MAKQRTLTDAELAIVLDALDYAVDDYAERANFEDSLAENDEDEDGEAADYRAARDKYAKVAATLRGEDMS